MTQATTGGITHHYSGLRTFNTIFKALYPAVPVCRHPNPPTSKIAINLKWARSYPSQVCRDNVKDRVKKTGNKCVSIVKSNIRSKHNNPGSWNLDDSMCTSLVVSYVDHACSYFGPYTESYTTSTTSTTSTTKYSKYNEYNMYHP